MAARIKEITLWKRGDFKTNEFLKTNSGGILFTFKTPMDVILSPLNTEKFKMAFRMVAPIQRTVITM